MADRQKQRARALFSVRIALISKARDAALAAIKIYNDPLIGFKSESFIVLMNIAWTYLLHAHYRSEGIDYRHYRVGQNGRKKYDLTAKGAKKHWELERCLNEPDCPLDDGTKNNLRFLIGIRHEIEHQMKHGLDPWLSGRYQACAKNFARYIKELSDDVVSIDQHLCFAIQFSEISDEQIMGSRPEAEIPPNLRAYVADFDAGLTVEEFNDPNFAVRLCFTRRLVNRPGQADRVVEFVPPSSPEAAGVAPERWVKKDVERKKFRPTDIVAAARNAGFTRFRLNPEHTNMWQSHDAKNPGKGFGVDVAGQWYWYQTWVDRVIELCTLEKEKYQ